MVREFDDLRIIDCCDTLKVRGVLCECYACYRISDGAYCMSFAIPVSRKGSVKVKTPHSCWWNADDDDLMRLGIYKIIIVYKLKIFKFLYS